MNTQRYLPLHPGDTGHWALLTCPRPGHTARDIELRPFQENLGTFYEVRCRLCGRDAEHHEGLPRAPGGRG